jgi:hypothetical protein
MGQALATADQQTDSQEEQANSGCSLLTFTQWLREIDDQPPWRNRADKEMDYCDGNQLNSEILMKQREIGMPPAIEPLIGPTIDSVLGLEAKTRTDWRVIPDSDKAGDEVAQALNYKLNQAERQSGADRANSEAYASQIKVGIGWVEVARNTDPFKPCPYRCESVHRNEIWWDFLSTKSDLSDARYLIRRRWTDINLAMLMFPGKEDVIKHAGMGWIGLDTGTIGMDGGMSTNLAMSWDMERGWSVEEQQWRDPFNKRICLYEVWYRIWERVTVLRMRDGRVVEYDENNVEHQAAIAYKVAKVQSAVVPRMKLSWWMGCHKLWEGDTPYPHSNFPYVPFWGKREDRTNVPYALVRGMMYLQDEVNARISKMQWGLSAVRTTRTKGAVDGSDEKFRQEVARPDADIILSQKEMAKPGAVFKVERDFELTDAQAQRLVDAREGIKRCGGIFNAFLGQDGQANSGVAIAGLVEQSNQSLADINDNYKYARAAVGDLLLSLITEDMLEEEQEVIIPATGVKEEQRIMLNQKTYDHQLGIEYRNNDIERTKLKVVLEDVPTTPSFRAQQLQAMSEAFKSMPEDYQRVCFPYLLALMDVPDKQDIINAMKSVDNQPSPEQMQQIIDDAVAKALTEAKVGIEQQKVGIMRFEAKARAHNDNIRAEAQWLTAETNALNADKEEETDKPAKTAKPKTKKAATK